MRTRVTMCGAVFALLLWGPLAALEAQVSGPGPNGRWPLQPGSPGSRTLAPFMEGWYENEDGSFSISFGYLNLNEETLEIPIGENNFIEPAEFDGMQPTVFTPGHQRGLFTANLPAVMSDQNVVWTLRKANGDVTSVPGRVTSNAYQLDWIPRPHGSVTPVVSFDSQRGEGRGPPGIAAERTLTTSVGSPLTVSINVREVSERDRADFRFFEPLTLQVVWSKHQGPVGGQVEFTRHDSTPIPEEPEEGRGGGGGRDRGSPPGPETITVPDDVQSTVRVVATFSEPGEYMLLGQVNNHRAPDSSSGSQCCWTNAYVRVTVR
jgi:hypothetical protein